MKKQRLNKEIMIIIYNNIIYIIYTIYITYIIYNILIIIYNI